MKIEEEKLHTRKLILGITGGIAAYKSAELVRLLIKAGYEVQVVMTKAACQFITSLTMQALSGKPVFTSMWDSSNTNGMSHIDLSRETDAILIAPASADFLYKLAHGRADDLLSTLCLARDCSLLVAPAMNKQMWENPATQRNIHQLRQDQVMIFGPDDGIQACGETGLGRMLEAPSLLKLVNAHFTPKLLKGKHVLITAGATLEMIDPVRAITNLSSGKMAYALAEAATDMGAIVTLISGVTTAIAPQLINNILASSAEKMYQAVMLNILNKDIFISVAAVADYTPTITNAQKIKKTDALMLIELTRTKDILQEVASLPNAPFCVGFAAETDSLLENASIKRKNKKLPLIIANDAVNTMGNDEASVTLLDDTGNHTLPKSTKMKVAHDILQHISTMLKT